MQGRVHIWDSGNIIADIGTETVYYIRVLTLIYAKKGETKTYYRFNGHGDVIALANSSGAIIKRYKYDSFGVEESPGIFDTNVFRYCGEYYDVETKTIYLRARYYDAETGRFTQQDGWEYAELGDVLSLNLYVYCKNDSVEYIDPSGHIAITVAKFIKGGIKGFAKGLFKGLTKAHLKNDSCYFQYITYESIKGIIFGGVGEIVKGIPIVGMVVKTLLGGIECAIDSIFEQLLDGKKIDWGNVFVEGVKGIAHEIASYILNETIAQNVAKGIKEVRAWMAQVFEQYSDNLDDIGKYIDIAMEFLLAEMPADFAQYYIEDALETRK